MKQSEDIKRFRINLQKEVDGAALYTTLADIEKQSQLAEVYRRMAMSEHNHAKIWEKMLQDAGIRISTPRPSWRSRVLSRLARHFGIRFVLPTISSNEIADSRAYDGQPEQETQSLSADEKSHAHWLSLVSDKGGAVGINVAQLEGRHRASGGNALRAAVLGANDGLVSILSLVMGVAGASMPSKDIFIAGLAGLLAGSGSMALGEWLSVQSSRELYTRQLQIEKDELDRNPAEEQEELMLIYMAKGLPEERASELAKVITADKGSALDTLAREELGIDPKELGGSAYIAALTSFLLFALGALFPILPFAFFTGKVAIIISMATSAVALFIVGAAITLMTGRNIFFSGFRQVIIGLVAALLTYGIGRLIGTTITGL